MGHLVTVVRNNIPSLYVKRCGTFAEGATWMIDSIDINILKKANDEGTNKEGKKVKALSFLSPTHGWVNFDEAYIPRIKHGKPPTDPVIVTTKSNKSRSEEVEVEDDEESVTEVEKTDEDKSEESSDTSKSDEVENIPTSEEVEEDKPKKKKIKILKRTNKDE